MLFHERFYLYNFGKWSLTPARFAVARFAVGGGARFARAKDQGYCNQVQFTIFFLKSTIFIAAIIQTCHIKPRDKYPT